MVGSWERNARRRLALELAEPADGVVSRAMLAAAGVTPTRPQVQADGGSARGARPMDHATAASRVVAAAVGRSLRTTVHHPSPPVAPDAAHPPGGLPRTYLRGGGGPGRPLGRGRTDRLPWCPHDRAADADVSCSARRRATRDRGGRSPPALMASSVQPSVPKPRRERLRTGSRSGVTVVAEVDASRPLTSMSPRTATTSSVEIDASPAVGAGRGRSPTRRSMYFRGPSASEIHRTVRRCARRAARAQVSAARTSSSVRSLTCEAGSAAYASTTSATVSTMSTKPIRPVVEGVDAHLVGGVVDRRAGATRLADPPGQRDRREGLVVERLELPATAPGSSRPARPRRRAARARTCPARSARASAAGRPGRSSSRRRTRPSSGSCCCGCTTTSMRSNGMSKSRCASMTSSPLLTRVAEFVVMTRPIAKFGCASACSGVTSASSARERPRNGPPLAVTTRRRTSLGAAAAQALRDGRCSESTGTIWPGAAAALTSGPPMMSDSLLASASVVPAAQRGERRLEPDGAGDAVDDDVGARARRAVVARVGADEQLGVVCRHARRVCRARDRSRQVVLRPARATATTGTRSATACSATSSTLRAGRQPDDLEAVAGCGRTRSRACVPIEPVEPSRTMRRGRVGVSVTPAFSRRPPVSRSGGHSPRPEQLLAVEGVGDGPGHAQAVHPDVVAP